MTYDNPLSPGGIYLVYLLAMNDDSYPPLVRGF